MAETASQREAELLRRQDALVRFGELALRSGRLEDILHEACRLVRETIGTDFSKVIELEADGRTLFVAAGIGWPPGIVGRLRFEIDQAVGEGFAIRSEEPVVSSDRERETRFQYAPFVRDAGVHALVNVPILGAANEPAFGILEVDSLVARHFSDDEVGFLRSTANLLGAAIERLRTFAELRRSEDHHRASVELNPQIPWTADPNGHVTGVSDRWLELTGTTRAEAAGEGWTARLHPEDLPPVQAAWALSIGQAGPLDIETRIRAADGRHRWFRIRAYPRRDDAGSVVSWYGTIEDIQDRRDLETELRRANETLEARIAERTRSLDEAQAEREATAEKLRQSQKMEAVGQLTGGLAHDFNNLLAGIIGSLDLLQMRLTQGRTADLDRYITRAMTSANRAAALTHRLLAFARRQTLQPKPLSANRLVAGMEDLLRRTVGPAIEVQTVLSGGVGQVLCDPNQLENALLNLAINARDAMPGGGRLDVATSLVTLDGRSGGRRDQTGDRDGEEAEYVVIAVSDTGTGMSADVVQHAFDPFFTTKPLGEGTGLGLSMIYGFATQSGGQVRIESEPGTGTTVSILLPRHEGDVDTAPDADRAPRPERGAGRSVLVVDDEPTVRMLVVEVLRELGHVVTEASDSMSALRELELCADVDLLVTDVGLPGGMNGRQLADAARARRPGLKTLFITGYAEASVAGGDTLEPGMEILVKPFAMSRLVANVTSLLGGDEAAPSSPAGDIEAPHIPPPPAPPAG